jgi:signal transduction histidine kinase
MAEELAGRLRAWTGRPQVRDAALAAALLVVCALANEPRSTMTTLPGVPHGDGSVVLWWVATVVAAAGIALRRRWPLPMLAVCTGTAVVHLALLVPLMFIDLSVPILLFTVAVRYGWAASGAVLAAMLLLAVGSSAFAFTKAAPSSERSEQVQRSAMVPKPFPPLPEPEPPRPAVKSLTTTQVWAIDWNDLPALLVTLVAAWAIGSGTRNRRAYLDELHARAADLERQRDQQAALAVAAERGRISRELHDVVAHGLSVMVVQAQGGAAALDNRPADTRSALEAIVKTGRDSLADMRRVLGTVGQLDDAWRPPPGLAGLPALLDQVRETGTPVSLRIEGRPVTLPSTVDLSAYRIVQEALTNTMKHAGAGAAAEVVVAYTTTALRVEIADDGSATAGGGVPGRGLRGMRERAALLGGRFEAGPRPSGGFAVRATLPLREHST